MSAEADILRLYDPPSQCGDSRCHDQFPELLYCVVVPCAVLVLLLLLVAVVACCKARACRCRKYSSLDSQPSAMELEDYNSIRRASAALRQMSHNRDTPLMGSRAGSMTFDRSHRRHPRARDSCCSAPGTLQRQNRNRRAENSNQTVPLAEAPPPYDEKNGGTLTGSSSTLQRRLARYVDEDMPSPPPPPPYRPHVEVFDRPDFFHTSLQVSMHSSVTYDDGSDHNSGGAQPLLQQQQQQQQHQQQQQQQQQRYHHQSRPQSNSNYSNLSQW